MIHYIRVTVYVAGTLLLLGAVAVCGREAKALDKSREILLDADALYNGYDAARTVLIDQGRQLQLDTRVFEFCKKPDGSIITDPIDLGRQEGLLSLEGSVKRVEIDLQADVPGGAGLRIGVRSGVNPFDQEHWSVWKVLDGLKGEIGELNGRFLQVRIMFEAQKPEELPVVTCIKLKPLFVPGKTWKGTIKVVEKRIEKIIRSPIEFRYERPDQEKLARFRKQAKLDEVIAGGKDDFEKLVKLMDWTGGCQNVRRTGRERATGSRRYYLWDIEKVFEVRDGKPTVYGHCMSYSQVLVSAATALGYKARHLCMVGFRDMSHEVVEIWVPSLGKWVYFDPSLTNYYFDKETKIPMNLIEMHSVVADNFVPSGKDMNWLWRNRESHARVREVGGKKHIGSRLGPWKYGTPMPKGYNWGWRHGYLAAGFVQMTPRNDFNSHPKANPRRFGGDAGYGGYPFWVDKKTPPRKGVRDWYTRMRDFYWTVDQASFRLVKTEEEGKLMVQLGHSMPFFKEYAVKIDNRTKSGVKNPFTWQLKQGINRLEVAPIDEFGRRGTASSITLQYKGN